MMMSGANCPNEHDVPVMRRGGGTGYKEYAPGTSNDLGGVCPPLPRGGSRVLAPYFFACTVWNGFIWQRIHFLTQYALRGTSIDSESRFPALLCAIDGRLNPQTGVHGSIAHIFGKVASFGESITCQTQMSHISRRPRHQLSKESMGI